MPSRRPTQNYVNLSIAMDNRFVRNDGLIRSACIALHNCVTMAVYGVECEQFQMA
jgi:hypothetical protein